jgi:cyclopropane-fatty-acyl-phospholipid synthase
MDKRSHGLSSQNTQAEVVEGPAGMPPPPVTAGDRWIMRSLMEMAGRPAVSVSLWDDQEVYRSAMPPVARLRILDRRALVRMLLKSDVGFGDAYSDGLMEVEGDLVEFLEAVYRGLAGAQPSPARREMMAWLNRPRSNSLATARDNIRHHYDIGNDFYRLWLDERMVYTCAYYTRPQATLDEAQLAKMDHVARKLRLEPGLTVVEAGCGWGALAIHMAQHYGVRVRAYNISHEQVAFARQRAKAKGLEDRVEFIEDDYRHIEGSYDRFVSVGMLEHVGPEHYMQFGKLIKACLKPSGVGLVHTIGRNRPMPNSAWIERRIFPGSRPPSLSEMAQIFEPFDFSVLDVENLRLHYARTCADWLERFNRVEDQVERMFDLRFVRTWRLYLAGSVAAFTTGSLQLFQVLFAPAENNELPWTRRNLYMEP